jgi:hypothetical protein
LNANQTTRGSLTLLKHALLVVLLAAVACRKAASPAGVVFESNWTTALGNSRKAIRDGGRWDEWYDSGGQLLTVVTGGPPGYANALRVRQRGELGAAYVQKHNFLPRSTDYYVRFYMKNDDTSASQDHVVADDFTHYHSLTYIRKSSGSSDWQEILGMFECGDNVAYPMGYWFANRRFALHRWYRFEFHITYVDATHIQNDVRVYDDTGTLITTNVELLQTDYGVADWIGSKTWTLKQYYDAGYSTCVNPFYMNGLSVGNNSQSLSVDTGLYWYYAGVQIRTDRWPGP